MMGTNPLQGPLKDPENLGPNQKSRFLGPTPSNGPSNWFTPIKIIKYKRHVKKQIYM